MSAAESAPAVSRPEGGWEDGDAVFLVSGGDAIVWQRTGGRWCRPQVPHVLRYRDDDIDGWLGKKIVYVHAPRELEPVMEPLPETPCAILATVRGAQMHLVGPGEDNEWRDDLGRCWWPNVHEITAWEPLLSRAEWEAEQDGDTVRGGRHG